MSYSGFSGAFDPTFLVIVLLIMSKVPRILIFYVSKQAFQQRNEWKCLQR